MESLIPAERSNRDEEVGLGRPFVFHAERGCKEAGLALQLLTRPMINT